MDQPLIELEHLSKIYRLGEVEIQPLKKVSLTFQRGEFISIMGASGSGKTTLMNIIGCLDRPTEGRYLLDGRDISQISSDELAQIRNKKFGFVFQSFNLLPRTTAIENIEVPLLYWNRFSSGERRRRVQEAMTRVGLQDRGEHYPSQLSGGQQQRVAVARALINTPSILLADEPTGNLDSSSEREVMDLFRQLNEEGITVILVTHNPDIARYARRIILMRDGIIQEP